MPTVFPEQKARDMAFWTKLYDCSKGDNFVFVQKVQLNQCLSSICIAQTDAELRMLQGRLIEILDQLTVAETAYGAIQSLIAKNKPEPNAPEGV